MKQHIMKLTLAFALITLLMPAMAQSTLGKDFWVSFLPHHEHVNYNNVANELELVVIGKRPCTGRVTNPNTQWSTTFEVQAGTSTKVSIPIEGNYVNNPAGFQEDSDCVLNHGLHVVTTDSVSLYASHKISESGEESSEATCVLPTPSLGSEYIIQTYPSLQGNAGDLSEFCIVATQNNTLVDITLTDKSACGHYANMPFSVVLQAGQCYQILSATSYLTERDFSGTHIKVRNGKRIAVFAGNNYASYYYYSDGYTIVHHLYEQMLPVSTWGQKFVVAGTQESRKGKVRITALNNACTIKRNGASVATIQARQTYDYEITSTTQADFIETSEPAQVFQYLSEPYDDLGTTRDGAPASVLISPLEQRIKDATFCTFTPSPASSYQNQKHYVNIVTETNCVSSMKLDGRNIASQFHPTPYNSGYSYARIQIQHGTHTLSSAAGGTNGGFVAQVYGLGDLGCYGFSAGSMVIDQSAQIMVDQQYSTNFANGFWFCEDDVVNFSLFTNYEVSRAEWSFGDNTTGTGVEVAHQYPQAGNYNVSCDVYKLSPQGQDSLMGTLTTKIHVQQPTEQDVYETDCDSHTWHGETYTESGVYTYHGHSIGGCDSIVNLHLTLHPTVTVPYDTAICDQYEWYGLIYTQSGVYTHVEGQTDFGCDSIAELHLTINHASPITIDGPRQAYVATNLISGIFLYRVSDSLNIAPNTLEWECTNLEWFVEPLGNGYSCHLLVTTSGQGTLKVITHNTEDCNTSSSIEINSIFYDVDENESMKVKLFPNPAQTKVTLVASQIQRVRIYSSIGQNLMDIPANHPDRLDIDISTLKQGIYIVEISTSVGKTTQRLSILR